MKPNNLKKLLTAIIEEHPDTIRASVAFEAIERDDIKSFFSDLQQYGCVSGMICPLIYYTDTHNFFDKYYDEIELIRDLYEDNHGEPLRIKGDLKNFLAWFAFEETAYQLAIELGVLS